MKVLTLQHVRAALIRIGATYTNRREDIKNQDVFRMMVEDYHKDFLRAGITTPRQLGDAIVQGRQTWTWFPMPAEIIEAHRDLCRSAPKPLMISQRPESYVFTAEEVERNKKLVALSLKAVTGQISFEECENMQNEIIGNNR